MKNTIIYRMKSRLITLLLLLITVSSVTFAQEAKKEIPLKYGATNEGKRLSPYQGGNGLWHRTQQAYSCHLL